MSDSHFEARDSLVKLCAVAFVAFTALVTAAVISEDHRNAVIASECVRSGQQWVDGDCVKAGGK